MKLALRIGGLLLAVASMVFLGGMSLPRDHVTAMSAKIMAPPATVWTALSDPDKYDKWRANAQTNLEVIEMLPLSPKERVAQTSPASGVFTMVMNVAEPPQRMVTRVVDDNVPPGGTWECVIEPDGANASRVTITERGSVSSPIGRLVLRFIIGETTQIEAYLRALGQQFGRDPIPVHIPVRQGAP